MIYIKTIETGAYMTPATFRSTVETISTGEYEIILLVNGDSVFEGAQEITALRARFAKKDDGTPLLDVFALMADDADICNRWLNDGGIEVFSKLSAWSKGINDAYKPSVTVTTEGDIAITEDVDGDYMKFSYGLDPKQDINIWESIERNVENALIQKILSEWMRLNRYMDDYALEKEKYEAFLVEARSCMMRVSTPYRRPIDPVV